MLIICLPHIYDKNTNFFCTLIDLIICLKLYMNIGLFIYYIFEKRK